eukprot:269092_1
MGACCKSGYSKLDDEEYRIFPTLQQHYEENMYCRLYPSQLIENNKNSWDTMRHFKIVFLGEPTVGKTSIISQKVSYKFDSEYTPTIEDYYVKVHRLNAEDINSFTQNANTLNNSLSYKQSLNNSMPHKQSGSFSQRYDANGNNYNNLPCYHCILDIQDTSGSLDFRQNINQWIWRSQVFVIVFDLTDHNTFVSIENSFISRIIELRKCAQPPIVLVGNKSDEINTYSIGDTHSSISSKKANSEINMVTLTYPNQNSKSNGNKDDKRRVKWDMIEELCNKYNITYVECSAKDRININHIFDICVKERLFHEAYWRKEKFMYQRPGNNMDVY